MKRASASTAGKKRKGVFPRGESVPEARKRIREAILSGVLKPGSVIREEELCLKFTVGRTPLRIALALLEEEGLVRKLPNAATLVSEPRVEDVRENVTLRYLIESMVVTVLASEDARVLPALLAEAEAVQARMKELIETFPTSRTAAGDAYRTLVSQFVELDMQFHSKLAEQSGFPWVAGQLRELRQRVLIYVLRNPQHDFDQQRLQDTYDQHQEILGQIRAGNDRAARECVYAHLTDVAKKWYPQILPFLDRLDGRLGLARSQVKPLPRK